MSGQCPATALADGSDTEMVRCTIAHPHTGAHWHPRKPLWPAEPPRRGLRTATVSELEQLRGRPLLAFFVAFIWPALIFVIRASPWIAGLCLVLWLYGRSR
ncbi:hypothetical protein AB6N24_14350 [Cellulomonas sp. 179-A 4D5 NHS]|uniref:hypothetical protein n=1 Tax=Cellulomonas sp. 179-A 4D5 NHS TaxID=3142378 RepID=UPI0039A2E30A